MGSSLGEAPEHLFLKSSPPNIFTKNMEVDYNAETFPEQELTVVIQS